MKLTIAQALATVLNIQQDGSKQYFRMREGIVQPLGKDLFVALEKTVEQADKDEQCHFAIFPIGSNREDYYMAIERELLRQEANPDFEGKKMWELLDEDPRQIMLTIMGQMRECAVSVVSPQMLQLNMLRVGCLVVATLQWISDWISRIRIREATLKAQATPPEPKLCSVVIAAADTLPPPALFGADGLRAVPEGKDEDLADDAQRVQACLDPLDTNNDLPSV